jgi:L-lactate dehydrogenase complex protein LldG
VTRSDQGRAFMLSRIRAALGVAGPDMSRQASVRDRLQRHPRGTIPARAAKSGEACVALLTEMLENQGADVTRAAAPEDAVRAIADDLRDENLRECDLAPSLRMGADPLLAGLPWGAAPAIERRFGRAEPSDTCALSRALVAAAETGTLFLISGADNPTTLNFLPEVHIVLISAGDIVGSYEAAWDRLRARYGPRALPRTVNLISGPSRTADIEQTIVRRAHGPRRLHVVILG